jgi:hypothetical protein
MRRIRICNGKIGLVFRNKNYCRVITSGKHWIRLYEKVKIYDMSAPFVPDMDLNIYLKDKNFSSLTDLVHVKDSEITLVFENGNFAKVLKPGRYAYWKGDTKFDFISVNLSDIEIDDRIDPSIRKNELLKDYVRVASIEPFEKGLLLINNRFVRELGMGEFYFWNGSIPVSVIKTDMRRVQIELPGQELLTKDKAALRVSFFAAYRVVDPVIALTANKDFEKQLYIFLQLALREYVGSLTLDELMERKQEVADFVQRSVKKHASDLGVEVINCGVRDVILPGEVREIMNQVLIASKKAQANIITRREETASARSLMNTAKLMEENEMLFKLKEMEFVEKIADKINTISVSGSSQIVDQLKQIFVPAKHT